MHRAHHLVHGLAALLLVAAILWGEHSLHPQICRNPAVILFAATLLAREIAFFCLPKR